MSDAGLESARQRLQYGDTDGAIRALQGLDMTSNADVAEAALPIALEIRARGSGRRTKKQCDLLIAYALNRTQPLARSATSGWYTDPAGVAKARYFSGTWSEQTSDSIDPRPIPPPQGPPPQASPEVEAVKPGSTPGTKVCPMCAEEVKEAAVICRFCGHQFGTAPAELVGQPIASAPPPVQPSEPPRTSGAAITAFICSILGLWIVGLPLGIYAQREVDRSGGKLSGRGFATAGIVFGVIGIVGTIIVIVVLVNAANHPASPGCTYTYNFNGACVPGT